MAKFYEAMMRSEGQGVAVATKTEERPLQQTNAVTKAFPEMQNDEDERCKQELIAHLNRFTPMKQPMKLSEKVANFFKVTNH